MSFDFFEHSMDIGAVQKPNEMYRCLEQAFIDEQWDNTTARQTIEEQDMPVEGVFSTFTFHKVEAWLNYVVEQTSTGTKNGSDFIQLTFRNIEHLCVRGRYYRFADSYYIGDYTNEYDSVVKTMTVRRCNNWMKIIDPKTGGLFSIPCVVGYDMSSPSVQVSSDIITPNNHATVIVQANADTLRLFKTNTRYIFNGRPFKLTGYQDTINYSIETELPTMLYLDLYLDEIRANDDLINQIADNGEYYYGVEIMSSDMELPSGSTGKLEAIVSLNGEQVNRDVVWTSSNKAVVKIDEDGNYSVVGWSGYGADIRAVVGDSYDTIHITISDNIETTPIINVVPTFNSVAEYETIEFTIHATYNGVNQEGITSTVSIDADSIVLKNENINIVNVGDNIYALSCLKRSLEPQVLYIKVNNSTPLFEAEKELTVELTSIFG